MSAANQNAESGVDIAGWVGRTTSVTEGINPIPVRQMGALLNQRERMLEPERGALPAGWHWCYFNPIETTDHLGPDGHPARGGFLPPVALPRRMWAGSRLRWERAFGIGSEVRKDSRILSVSEKAGRKGRMVFVAVEHQYHDAQGLILREEHDIVYRDDPGAEELAALARVGEEAAAWRAAGGAFERSGTHAKPVSMGPVELFRYSAATFNGHRIHYDLDYCRQVEGYPALVVHGPLIATLLLDFIEHELAAGQRIATFDFRAVAPTFALEGGFHLHASPDESAPGHWRVWSTNATGRVGVDGTLTLAQ